LRGVCAWLGLELLGPAVDDALIMFGVLQIAFGEDDVARGSGVLGEGEVFFTHLMRGAADSYVRAVAVENLVAILRWTALAAVIMTTMAAVMAAVPRASIL
jgi:hypothetical protein